MGLGNCLLPAWWSTQREVSMAARWLSDPGCPDQHFISLRLSPSLSHAQLKDGFVSINMLQFILITFTLGFWGGV